jgi:hypothetical protein
MVSRILPTGYNIGTQSISVPTDKDGGVAVGITAATSVSAGQPLTQTRPFSKLGTESLAYTRRSEPVAISGGAMDVQKAYAAGTFAYDQVAFLMRTYSSTVNGVANTTLLYNGNEQHRQRRYLKQKDMGASLLAAHRAGYWQPLGIANQRSNWSTSPTALSNTFTSTTNNAVDSDDQGIYVTFRSIPGELVYMEGSLTPKQDDYKAITG